VATEEDAASVVREGVATEEDATSVLSREGVATAPPPTELPSGSGAQSPSVSASAKLSVPRTTKWGPPRRQIIKRILNPRSLSKIASYDVASTYAWSVVGVVSGQWSVVGEASIARHIIETHCEPYPRCSSQMASY